jgi:hypothetical protein
MRADGDEILLMQEPYSIGRKIPGFKSRNTTPFEVAGLCTTYCVCVQISDGETEIYATSQYFPPIENIEVGIEQLDKGISEAGKPLLA